MAFTITADGLPGHASGREWLAVASVALGTFALVSSEFLPVGLLTKIAADLGASEGSTGLMVTVPGFVAALASPGVMLLAGRLDRRIILLALSTILVLSNIIVATAHSLPIVVIGRVLLGIDIGAFWAVSSVIAMRIVPEVSAGRANSIIFAGISVGTVIGVPTGALIGDLYGWRSAFGGVAIFGVLVLATQMSLLPRLPASEVVTVGHLKALFGIPKARLGLMVILVAFMAQFGAYTYMGAFLEHVTRAPATVLSFMLLGYGLAGILGNFVGGTIAKRNPRGALAVVTLLLGSSVILLPFAGTMQFPASILVVLWGAAWGALPIATQMWMLYAAPAEMESASAMYISVLQLGLASGALVGGTVVDHTGLSMTLTIAGCAALATAAAVMLFGRDRNGKPT
jgi:predicted MFS family arabinose efflux permease